MKPLIDPAGSVFLLEAMTMQPVYKLSYMIFLFNDRCSCILFNEHNMIIFSIALNFNFIS